MFYIISETAENITSMAMDKLQNGKDLDLKSGVYMMYTPVLAHCNTTRYRGPISRSAECRYDTTAQHTRLSTKALSR
jgi:hypothetical protein